MKAFTTCEKCNKIVRTRMMKNHVCNAHLKSKENDKKRKEFYAENPSDKYSS